MENNDDDDDDDTRRPIPKSKAIEYFKSIRHACRVCICIEIQCLQTCSYTENTPPKLWNSKKRVRKLNTIRT